MKWDAAGSPNGAFDSEKAQQVYAHHARDPNAKAEMTCLPEKLQVRTYYPGPIPRARDVP